jgi:polyhydroxyalkanoate synthesis regulator phasin
MGRTWLGKAAALMVGVAVLFFVTNAATAQEPARKGTSSKSPSKPPTKSLAAQVKEQKQEIEAQAAQIEGQKARIERQIAAADSQAVKIDSLETRLQGLEEQLAALKTRLAGVEMGLGNAAPDSLIEARLKAIEEETKKSPELPPDVVSAGDFPGSMRIPGTDAAIKFGGRVRTAAVFTLDPLGTDDRFLTNSIPVGEPVISGEDKRTNISARASRLNVEFRTPIGSQEVRAFFEGDFAGENSAFRLRHSYAQFLGFIVGQTWSTFSDPAANHEDLDFEGVSSENLIRQPLIRYWWYTDPKTRAAVAIETPAVSITGGEGVNLLPDLVGRVVREGAKGGHVQVAAVIRQIRGEAIPGDVRADWGWGLSGSGVFPFKLKSLQDRVIFQVNGGMGIARYINDLNSLGGQDAVFDTTTGDLKALPAFGWYIAYEHSWKEWEGAETMNLRSTFLWSFVDVLNYDFQPPDAYAKTHRFAVNLVFSPAKRVDVGLEFLNGYRENKNGEHGSANQLQLVALIRF